MKCWHCGTEIIWGGDFDISEEDPDYELETNMSCPECGTFYLIYKPKDDEQE